MNSTLKQKPISPRPIAPKGTFWSESRKMLFLVRCPKCKAENYSPNAATGICTWCGFDANAPIKKGKK
jgi:ribosomal protein L37E